MPEQKTFIMLKPDVLNRGLMGAIISRIEDQNYGFDLEKNLKEVQLKLDAERYYMIVKMLK